MSTEYYLTLPLEFRTFEQETGFLIIGFRFIETAEREEILTKFENILTKYSQTLPELKYLQSIIEYCIMQWHVVLPLEGDNNQGYSLPDEVLVPYITSEKMFSSCLYYVLEFLRQKATRSEILQINVLHYLFWLDEKLKEVPKIDERKEAFSDFIDFSGYKTEEKRLNKYSEESFLEDEETKKTSPSEFLYPKTQEFFPWWNTKIKEEKFPLFTGAEKYLQMMKLVSHFVSLERGLPENIIIKLWETEKIESNFLSFLEFTLICQRYLLEPQNV